MTASLAGAEKGKPSGVGRCLLATDDLPLRQPRRISNLFGVQPAARLVAGALGWMPRGDAPPNWRRRAPFETPVAASLDAAFLSDRETCGGVRHPTGGRCRIFFARENLSLTNRLQPASDPVREGAKSDPGVGLLHSLRMEKTNDRVVAPAYVNERR